MWDRFSQRAKRAVYIAQEEARLRGLTEVEDEHLLLGLVSVEGCTAVKVLARLGVEQKDVKERITPLQSNTETGIGEIQMKLAPSAKTAIDRAYSEARQLQNGFIGTEHLLLGLLMFYEEPTSIVWGPLTKFLSGPSIREVGLAGRLLAELGVELKRAREVVAAIQEDMASSTDVLLSERRVRIVHNVASIKRIEDIRGRSISSIQDLSTSEILTVLDIASLFKETIKVDPTAHMNVLPGRTLAMIFEKPSLRTRVTFETGMTQLGGHAIYLAPSDIQLGARETVPDVARNLSRWCDVIMARVFSHNTITGLAENASIPVINALCDLEHPCQALADFQTIREKKGSLEGLKLAFIGDGNNVANSLMLLAAKVGTNFAIGCPEGYEPLESIVEAARECAGATGANIEVVTDPFEAVRDADVIYTDVWASMGQETQAEVRKMAFSGYQVNSSLVSRAKPDAIVMHCLPAHRGEEITEEVLDGPQSVVFDEAENRLHAQKALLALVVK